MNALIFIASLILFVVILYLTIKFTQIAIKLDTGSVTWEICKPYPDRDTHLYATLANVMRFCRKMPETPHISFQSISVSLET